VGSAIPLENPVGVGTEQRNHRDDAPRNQRLHPAARILEISLGALAITATATTTDAPT